MTCMCVMFHTVCDIVINFVNILVNYSGDVGVQSTYIIKRSSDIGESVAHIKSCHVNHNQEQQVSYLFLYFLVYFLTNFYHAMQCIVRTMLSQDVCPSMCPSVCLSVCLSVTRRYFDETVIHCAYRQTFFTLVSHTILVLPYQILSLIHSTSGSTCDISCRSAITHAAWHQMVPICSER